MNELSAFLSGFFEADVGATGLKVAAVRAARNFAVGAGRGHPDFQVVGFGGGKSEVAGTEFDHAIGQLQALQNGFGVFDECLVFSFGGVGTDEFVHFNFVELMQPDQPPSIASIAARFAAETGVKEQ
jgi:hypothetical protein